MRWAVRDAALCAGAIALVVIGIALARFQEQSSRMPSRPMPVVREVTVHFQRSAKGCETAARESVVTCGDQYEQARINLAVDPPRIDYVRVELGPVATLFAATPTPTWTRPVPGSRSELP